MKFYISASYNSKSMVFRLPRPSVYPSFRPSVCLCVRKKLHSLQSYSKMQLLKVGWYVFRVKNMHPGSPSHPSGTAAAEAKSRCVYSILKPHGQSSRYQVRILLPRQNQSTCSEFHHLPRVGPKQLCALAHLGCTRAAGTS